MSAVTFLGFPVKRPAYRCLGRIVCTHDGIVGKVMVFGSSLAIDPGEGKSMPLIADDERVTLWRS